MYSPSSNADQRACRAPDSIGFPGEGFAPQGDLPGAERFIREHAPILGTAASWFVRQFWSQAAHHAYQESLQLLEHAYRYTPARLERCCEQALLYGLSDLAAIRYILAEQLDSSPLRPEAQEAGQLTFPFVDLERP
jgi:hypothetical protein